MKNSSLSIFINITIGILGLIILIPFLFSNKIVPSFSEYIQQEEEKKGLISITFASNKIEATIATSSVDLEKGLGGRAYLPPQEGMLFVFSELQNRSFWMRDMLFPIDIIWINEKKEIVGVTSNIKPETYPDLFYSPVPIKYVLELNSGMASKFGMATGTPLQFVI